MERVAQQDIDAIRATAEEVVGFWRRSYRERGYVKPGVLIISDPEARGGDFIDPTDLGALGANPQALRHVVQQVTAQIGARWVVLFGLVKSAETTTGYDGRPLVLSEEMRLIVVADGLGLSVTWTVVLRDDGSTGDPVERENKAGDGPFAGISGLGPAVAEREEMST